jgi:hypothetical protein
MQSYVAELCGWPNMQCYPIPCSDGTGMRCLARKQHPAGLWAMLSLALIRNGMVCFSIRSFGAWMSENHLMSELHNFSPNIVVT